MEGLGPHLVLLSALSRLYRVLELFNVLVNNDDSQEIEIELKVWSRGEPPPECVRFFTF